MRINRRLQYGLLLVFYLSRSGRSTTEIASQNLSVSKYFLEQVARDLRIAGVIKSIRGPYGGYELVGEPEVSQVLHALQQFTFFSPQELANYRRGELEHRALARLVDDLYFSSFPVFNRKAKDIVSEVVRTELYVMNNSSASTSNN